MIPFSYRAYNWFERVDETIEFDIATMQEICPTQGCTME
jgi:hypothetical protein